MITLEHIRKLDQKVSAAITTISALRGENEALKEKLGDYEKRIQELEKLVDEFKEDQSEIEQGILNALSQLDKLEDDMSPAPAAVAADTLVPEEAEDSEEAEESSSELDIF